VGKTSSGFDWPYRLKKVLCGRNLALLSLHISPADDLESMDTVVVHDMTLLGKGSTVCWAGVEWWARVCHVYYRGGCC